MKIGSGWKKSYTDKDTNEKVGFISLAIDAIPLEALKNGTLNVTVFNAKEKKSDASPDYDIVWSNMKKSNNNSDDMPSF